MTDSLREFAEDLLDDGQLANDHRGIPRGPRARPRRAPKGSAAVRPPAPQEEVEAWLRDNGWHPGRREREAAEQLVEARVQDSVRQGFPLAPWGEVTDFVSRYAGLVFPMPQAPERKFVPDPTMGYADDAEDIVELATDLGHELFPVGYETVEAGIVLMDDIGRFFYLHHTGPYFLGKDEAQALSSLMRGDQDDVDACFV
ncbi:SUKH-3 domain-containing protein [Streptomyces sp. NPDC056400]|uniref:SUKH-3 domain-containing protein n=1 Tax=Streptomyces sp. NPDC056400 TaxID=3345808 RepID=UPI0035DB09BB